MRPDARHASPRLSCALAESGYCAVPHSRTPRGRRGCRLYRLAVEHLPQLPAQRHDQRALPVIAQHGHADLVRRRTQAADLDERHRHVLPMPRSDVGWHRGAGRVTRQGACPTATVRSDAKRSSALPNRATLSADLFGSLVGGLVILPCAIRDGAPLYPPGRPSIVCPSHHHCGRCTWAGEIDIRHEYQVGTIGGR